MPTIIVNIPMSRRRLLALIGASVVTGVGTLAGVAGCKPSTGGNPGDQSGHQSGGAGATTSTKPPSVAATTQAAVVQRAANNERTLIAAYDSAVAAYPELAARLQPLRANHVRHLDGLVPGASAKLPAAAPATPTPTLTPSAPAAPTTEPPPGVLAGLASLEHTAAGDRVNDVAATSGSLARLLASIGGCEAAHESLLRAPA